MKNKTIIVSNRLPLQISIENNQDQKTEIERFYKKKSNRNKLLDDLLDSKILDLLKENSKVVEKDMQTSDLHHHHNHQ